MKSICKKTLVIGIILLFVGVSVSSAISIIKNVDVSSFDPKPDLECEGSIINHRVKPGYTFDSLFSIWNEGEEGSLLNWEIVSWPDWGSWSFNQLNGSNLEASEMVGIEVTITVPDEGNGNFLGDIRVINTDDSSDYDDVGVHITTTRSNNLKSNNEDDCGCNEVSDADIVKIERLLDRVTFCSNLLSTLLKHVPEIKKQYYGLLHRINKLNNVFEILTNPPHPILCFIMELIGAPIWIIEGVLEALFHSFQYTNPLIAVMISPVLIAFAIVGMQISAFLFAWECWPFP